MPLAAVTIKTSAITSIVAISIQATTETETAIPEIATIATLAFTALIVVTIK